jgi:hypothetical protein
MIFYSTPVCVPEARNLSYAVYQEGTKFGDANVNKMTFLESLL